jgi:hypothetical protein
MVYKYFRKPDRVVTTVDCTYERRLQCVDFYLLGKILDTFNIDNHIVLNFSERDFYASLEHLSISWTYLTYVDYPCVDVGMNQHDELIVISDITRSTVFDEDKHYSWLYLIDGAPEKILKVVQRAMSMKAFL